MFFFVIFYFIIFIIEIFLFFFIFFSIIIFIILIFFSSFSSLVLSVALFEFNFEFDSDLLLLSPLLELFDSELLPELLFVRIIIWIWFLAWNRFRTWFFFFFFIFIIFWISNRRTAYVWIVIKSRRTTFLELDFFELFFLS